MEENISIGAYDLIASTIQIDNFKGYYELEQVKIYNGKNIGYEGEYKPREFTVKVPLLFTGSDKVNEMVNDLHGEFVEVLCPDISEEILDCHVTCKVSIPSPAVYELEFKIVECAGESDFLPITEQNSFTVKE